MIKKIIAFVLSAIMVVTLIPTIAFANPENEAVNQEPATTPETIEIQEDEEVQVPEISDETNETVASPQEVEEFHAEIMAKAYEKKEQGEFEDEGSFYQIENVANYSSSMNIYAFYLGSGAVGDAVLIESNGKYLLMDTGAKSAALVLRDKVRAVMGSNNNLDIYISHMHGDHTGGLETMLTNFDVGKVYFPDIEVCENYYTPNTERPIDDMYSEHVALAKGAGADVIYLRPDSSVRPSTPRAKNTYSQFNVGGVVCSVIGPIGTYKPDDFVGYVRKLNGNCGTKEGHSLNNSSLCTILTCGSARYISTGDIEKREEAKLVGRYGYGLDCNIMKMPHHGLRTSCTEGFASRVTPMWSFAQNHGYTGSINPSGINVAKKHGYLYMVASNRRSLIYEVNNNAIRLFRDYNNNCRPDDGLVTGWISDGIGTQYYDGVGHIHTGWKWISKSLYYMDGTTG